MNHGIINFKIFLRNGATTEARRFSVDDASVITNFLFMKEKIQTVFPVLREAVYKVTWKDSDNDEITITSDEDLIMAYTEMVTPVKVLYVTVMEQFEGGPGGDFMSRNEEVRPPSRVVCDVCSKVITTFRYKCLQCPDYDLCADCEHKGNHSRHVMLRVTDVELPRCIPKLMGFVHRSMRKADHHAAKQSFRKEKHHEKHCRKESTCPQNKENFPDEEHYGFDIVSNLASMAAPFLQQFCGQTNPSECPFKQSQPQPAAAAGSSTATAAPSNATPNVNAPPQPETNTSNTTKNPYDELIRGAIQSFFNHLPTAPTGPQGSSNQSDNTSKPTSAPSSFGGTPMETDLPQAPQQQPVSDIYPQLQKEKMPEPGWTFVPKTGNSGSTPPSAPSAAAAGESDKIKEGLQQLLDMGFSNEINLIALLKRFNGNVGQVVKYLFENN